MGAPVAFFSLEMSADQLATRILAEQSRIPSSKLRKGAISQAEFRDLARAAADLEALPLYIDDTPPPLDRRTAHPRAPVEAPAQYRRRGGRLSAIAPGLLPGGGKENRVQEISEISRGLKTLAKELDCPVIGLSQLSRAVEQRDDKKPQLSDLRESGSIEQDADIVLFVFPDEDYYHGFAEPPMITENSSSEDREKRSEWELKNAEIAGRAQVHHR